MLLLFILIPLIIVLLGLILPIIFGTRGLSSKGDRGEQHVSGILESCKLEGDKLIDDIILVNPENGMTAQIDHILLSTRGIFVVETKNLSGIICGNDESRTWRQVLGNTVKKIHSPVKQNATHVYVLNQILKTNTWIENIVVFVQGNVQGIHSTHVYTPTQLVQYMESLTATHRLSAEERDKLYEQLLPYKEHPAVTKKEHVRNIRNQQVRTAHNICPRCNSKLVLRNGKFGQFYGCSNYPTCKFTKEV